MNKQTAFIVIVAMVFSAHNANIILKAEDNVMGVLRSVVGLPDSSTTPVPAPPAGTIPASGGPQVHGVDISHWQGDIRPYFKLNPDDWSFVITKASEGYDFVDTQFELNWAALDSVGMIKGAYHFFLPDDNATRQAEHFLSVVDSIKKTDLAPIVDVETASLLKKISPTEMADSLLNFLTCIETKTGRTPIIYTNYTFGSKYLTDPRLAKYPLWIADVAKEPRMIGSWTSWFFWQRGKDIIDKDKKIDHDYFNGTMETLKEFIQHY